MQSCIYRHKVEAHLDLPIRPAQRHSMSLCEVDCYVAIRQRIYRAFLQWQQICCVQLENERDARLDLEQRLSQSLEAASAPTYQQVCKPMHQLLQFSSDVECASVPLSSEHAGSGMHTAHSVACTCLIQLEAEHNCCVCFRRARLAEAQEQMLLPPLGRPSEPV